MEKLTEAVKLASAPQRLKDQSFLLDLPVPSWIASMVCMVITELGEENGSSEESISDYIKANFDDLPWDHKSIPSHHLNRLCHEGLIVLLASNRYSIPGFTSMPVLKDSEAPKLITYRKLHGQKRRVFFQEEREIDGLKDEHVKNGCELSIIDRVKTRARKIERKCDQLLIEGTEEESSSSEDYSDDDDHCYPPLEGAYKQTDRLVVCALAVKSPNPIGPKQRVTSQLIIALEDDSNGDDSMNNGDSFERLVEGKQEEVADKQADRRVVYALAARLPNQAEPTRRVNRRFIKSKDQPNMKLLKFDDQPEASILSSQETESKWPSWIQSLLQTDFYGQCKVHGNVEKSICNSYCADCKNGALCTSCVTSHEGHHVIPINQTDCEAAVEASVIGKHIHISEIQTLKTSITNANIVLKRTIPSWFSKSTNNVCLFCKRRAPYPFKFCALSCKFKHEHKVG